MKRKTTIGLFGLLLVSSASAQSLYYVGSEAQESLPLKWVVGADVIYDDNVNPGFGAKDSSFGIQPYVGLSFVNMTPQTTWDVYARLGLIYYFDAPAGVDSTNSESRAGINLTHRFNERLRFSSRNFVAYELEPDYSYGYASSRQIGEYFYWSTDNSVGYRWTERFATYTGVLLNGTTYADISNNDRFTWQAYNQFRYQLSPQTVLTARYAYGQTTGNGFTPDYTNQYVTAGVEHRFSPNTIGILDLGAQFQDVQGGVNSSSPYGQFALNSQINQQFRIRSFARYGIDNYDTIRSVGPNTISFDDKTNLRFGISGDYAVSRQISIFGGIDYIPSNYADGQIVQGPPGSPGDFDENIFNGYVGLSYKFNDMFTGTATYNYTDSSSDFVGGDYTRNRFSIGLSAEF